ncbi:MAG: hypothetical protein UW30_C0008G0044 [Candidatus Giovannonibacteria bacterium GW2011_GWA2_44_13b]|uniref:Uncharacterized protein n=2 Tax=Candidatus Giovannoniibacteriota TaxID=1752738 RepID=A0A0G1H3R0_9BACT|nr:MAG: hypothetical protein UW30_C0008G0044 [Candidatus Giovannonibacteria bacterium GW2011_GWA2_44_13b]OGF82694.1 MAG: hypothetical protein A2924_00825 [Candidatus Giovannonibacteria bacterium RIFCSPLOWO2_01_FULL_44_16]
MGKKRIKKAFLVCSVRNATPEQKTTSESYVKNLETKGYKVHWPPRDTNQQDDLIGLRICSDNRAAIKGADEVHIMWDPNSQGSLFDIGMAFAFEKKIVLANPDAIQPTQAKSFNNVLLTLDKGFKK